MHRFGWFFMCLMLVPAPLTAQDSAADEVREMRAAALAKEWQQALSLALAPRQSWSWQTVTPRRFRWSLRDVTPLEYKPEPRLITAERGPVDRYHAATEQWDLGLSADPPRPEFPLLDAGPRRYAPSPPATEIVQLPPLGRTSEAKISLLDDPATRAVQPYVRAIVTATRGPSPPRNIGVPDPFEIQEEIALPMPPVDADPPAISLGSPERPELPVVPPAMP